MSYKTDKLVSLFPDPYAAEEPESLLYKLLDVFGAALVRADDAVRQLLRSHWVEYASGSALDGLGSIYGVVRRQLQDDTLETDDAFRQRLRHFFDCPVGVHRGRGVGQFLGQVDGQLGGA